MQFFEVPRWNIQPPQSAKYPCVLLVRSDWNDYSYETSFNVQVLMTPSDKTDLGVVKILQRGELRTQINSPFSDLGTEYVSLGQSIDYYRNLFTLPDSTRKRFTRAMRDALFDKSSIEPLSQEPGFTTSLLRFPEAMKLWNEGMEGFKNPSMDAFEFAFTTRLPGFIADHVIKFSFLDLQHVPNRINVLIGKNGAGKTSLLRQLADAIGGGSEPLGVFSPLRPPFSRALAVSYSAFDPFRRSQQTVDGESYRYIGIYENDTLRTRDAIATSCGNAIRRVHELKREDTWHEVIDSALGTTVAESLKGCFTPREDIGHRIRNLYLSSGQLMLATIVSELNAYIEKDAVVLLDEPETHLHPNAIGALLRGLDTLLRRLGAFAIIATHSPLVVQQIPRRYVRVLRSIDRVPTVAVLEEECFGENLTSITQDVFHGCETPSLFQIWTRDPAGALALSTDSAFVRELGFAAKTSLASSKLQ